VASPSTPSAVTAGEESVTLPSIVCDQGAESVAAGSSMSVAVLAAWAIAVLPVGLLSATLNCRGSCGVPVFAMGTVKVLAPVSPSAQFSTVLVAV
jgi:hypothetical protein